jgi:N-methylhydantoinase A
MDFVQTINSKLAAPEWDRIREWFAEKEKLAVSQFEQEKEFFHAVVALRSADVRFEGQGFNTEVAVSDEILGRGDTAGFTSAFHAQYEQLYGVRQDHVPGELVNIRLTVIGQRAHNQPSSLTARGKPRPASSRAVYFDGERQAVRVYQRSELAAGAKLDGPCIVDQDDTTTFIKPNWGAEVDGHGVLHLTRK